MLIDFARASIAPRAGTGPSLHDYVFRDSAPAMGGMRLFSRALSRGSLVHRLAFVGLVVGVNSAWLISGPIVSG